MQAAAPSTNSGTSPARPRRDLLRALGWSVRQAPSGSASYIPYLARSSLSMSGKIQFVWGLGGSACLGGEIQIALARCRRWGSNAVHPIPMHWLEWECLVEVWMRERQDHGYLHCTPSASSATWYKRPRNQSVPQSEWSYL
jgi:hypothetical protein